MPSNVRPMPPMPKRSAKGPFISKKINKSRRREKKKGGTSRYGCCRCKRPPREHHPLRNAHSNYGGPLGFRGTKSGRQEAQQSRQRSPLPIPPFLPAPSYSFVPSRAHNLSLPSKTSKKRLRTPFVFQWFGPHFAYRQSSQGRGCRRPTRWRLGVCAKAPSQPQKPQFQNVALPRSNKKRNGGNNSGREKACTPGKSHKVPNPSIFSNQSTSKVGGAWGITPGRVGSSNTKWYGRKSQFSPSPDFVRNQSPIRIQPHGKTARGA